MSAGRKILIYVRGRRHEVEQETINFDQVVNLAYPVGKRGPQYEYDVKWKDGPRGQETGILREGDSVKVIEEMKFDVKFTDKS